ncbi:transcriptional regulator with XRE-family HTH domain [Cytobacillus horneckiae]|uniref:helix-turn-helix domain-containing protein n=1 Tax=Cytobacillus horneckiae TaxID=549687 RepID=UPI0019D042A4|nr:helix-turn-helix transcriptional regulator [Cytobacillus horneckiae]MBN6887773.1 helix-turn-helix transcriptional regulator [Cytobacillus horneckiae]
MKSLNLHFIKRKRQTLNISLQEMAESLGFKNASTYLKYENGTYAFKADQLPTLAIILRCSITDFFINKISKTAI